MLALKKWRGSVATLLTLVAAQVCAADDYQQGQLWLQQRMAHSPAQQPARNIIFFLGDGMSITTLTAGRIFQGQQRGEPGEENFLAFERFEHSALIQTYNSNQQTPDSAGTMTALMTGVKTRAGMINIGPEQPRAVCQGSEQYALRSLLQWAQAEGYATGVVTNARITHATPAATYAHSPERNWEGEQDLPAEARQHGCEDIATQLIRQAFPAGLDVALGGGRRNFSDALLAQFDGQLVTARQQLLTAQIENDTPLLGLFADSHMAYAHDRLQSDALTADQPSLPEMTRFALQRLQHLSHGQPRGFVLVVEGARIDHAHHLGNAYRALVETNQLSDSVALAQQLAHDDTLLVVTADHSHTLSMAGYPQRGNPILGLVQQQDDSGQLQPTLASDQQPYTTLGYANGLGSQLRHPDHLHAPELASNQRRVGRLPWLQNSELIADPLHADYCQTALLPTGSETHGSDDVALHARGPGAQWFHGLLEQHSVYHILRRALAAPTQPQEF
ncbi:alkaline phosphatase [Bacterioplanes sanyensis]|uniref:alkaline phosphatase n=1 Tax=Bacterioplanes sanyensis TaxID=1249553 RepID=UPI00167BD4F6|nr:alkaline phosphatase [Bacterioplanes sanyensis]